ncbi:turripeptide Lol9.1-like [Liolophura sinensis]|uniref:turripeptide Lol9.1-like n=1 Tax=Liolophura sinensis TaxID=3198878 RepID=UPI0031594319
MCDIRMKTLLRGPIALVLLLCVGLGTGNKDEGVVHFEKTDERLCLRACPQIFSPVCGNDGVTYANTCEMETQACRLSKPISVDHWGEC